MIGAGRTLGEAIGVDVPVVRLVEQIHHQALQPFGPEPGEMSAISRYEDLIGRPLRVSDPAGGRYRSRVTCR